MEYDPHALIEGMAIAAHALGSHTGYIYTRGEYKYLMDIMDVAINEAREAGILGKNVLGSDLSFDIHTHSGAGAYICGEETALLSSLEGYRGHPRMKPPFPAVEGLYACPTVVNNVETLAAVKYIIRDGAEGYRKYGTEKSAGSKLFSLSGNVNKPGNYEVPLGYPLKDMINGLGGGIKNGRKLKAVIPGGSSAPVLTAEEALKATLDYENLAAAGTMLGSGAIIVIDDSKCMVECLANLTHFYHHESCGQCTPCREGTGWADKIVHSILSGKGRLQDIELLVKVADNMKGKTICALSDAAALPIISFVTKFRDEFEYFVKEGKSKVKGTAYKGHAYAATASH